MADSAAPAPSFGLPKATLIHVACEALIIAVAFFMLNRKISAQHSDLVECAVRIAAQNKRISELEDRLQEVTDKVGALSMNLAAMASVPKPPRMPTVFPTPMWGPPEQPVPAPAPVSIPVAAPTPAPTPAPIPESFQPFRGSENASAESESPDSLDSEIASELGELAATASQ
jgi:hypothetical protein